jgi:hypothetical protein
MGVSSSVTESCQPNPVTESLTRRTYSAGVKGNLRFPLTFTYHGRPETIRDFLDLRLGEIRCGHAGMRI